MNTRTWFLILVVFLFSLSLVKGECEYVSSVTIPAACDGDRSCCDANWENCLFGPHSGNPAYSCVDSDYSFSAAQASCCENGVIMAKGLSCAGASPPTDFNCMRSLSDPCFYNIG